MGGLLKKRFQAISLVPEWLLIKQAKLGDRDAFGKLYQKYLDRLYRYIYFRVGQDTHMAEDMTHNVFTKAWEKLKSFKEGSFQAWLYTIARNAVIDYYRSARTTVALEEEVIDETQMPEENLMHLMQVEKVKRAFAYLTSEQQDVVTMRFINDMSHKEIAHILGKKEDAVRALQYRALKELKKYVYAY